MAGLTSDMSYIESEQFSLNFPIVMKAVSDYMKTEYNEGRLKDTNYATVQAQAVQSAIQACLTLTMQTDSQVAQAAEILAGTIRENNKASTQIESMLVENSIKEAQSNKDIEVKSKQIENVTSEITVRNEQSTKDLLVKAQQIISMTKDDDVKTSQKAIIDQQKLTEVQNTSKVAYEVSTLLPDEHNLKAKQALLVEQQELTETQNTILVTNQASDILKSTEVKSKQIESMDIENTIKEVQSDKDLLVKAQQITSMTKEDDVKVAQKAMLDQQKLTELQNTAKAAYEVDTLLPDEHNVKLAQIDNMVIDNTVKELQSNKDLSVKDAEISVKNAQASMVTEQKNTEVKKQITETNQGDMLLAQASMIVAQTQEVAPNATKQRAVQDAQISQVNRETNYTLAKTDVMVKSRLDNLVIETAKMQQQKVMGLGNGALVPSANDFVNEAGLMQALYNRAKEENMPDLTIAVSTGYTAA